jgi:hypothetical protein
VVEVFGQSEWAATTAGLEGIYIFNCGGAHISPIDDQVTHTPWLSKSDGRPFNKQNHRQDDRLSTDGEQQILCETGCQETIASRMLFPGYVAIHANQRAL